ncbi:uncharacterized protein [Solanum lycopersicum]|uniref:uncharacterized protein n=1 Tax=Solanum lycopersicum TaxID=4081 RepID=UPI003749CB45
MEKYIPQALRDRRRNEFLILEQGRMYVASYKTKFRALSRYATKICFSPQERIRHFVKGLRSDLQILALQVAAAAKSFQKVVDFVIVVEGSYRPPIVRGRGCHRRGRHSGGRGGQGNGGHQISRGSGHAGATAAQHDRGNGQTCDRAHCYAFPGRFEVDTSDALITNCNAKTVTLAKPGTDSLVWEGNYIFTQVHIISFFPAKRMFSKGCLAFLAHLRDDTSQVHSIEFVSIVREFPDVFPADLPGTRLDLSSAFHAQTDVQSEQTIQVLEDMLRASGIEFGGHWDNFLHLEEFSYNNSYHSSIDMAPFEGEQVLLKVSPMKGVMRFGKRGKLSPRYNGQFEVLKRVGEVAYELALPLGLSGVHPVFHVSMLKKYHGDGNYIIRWDSVLLDENLSYDEERVAILDREVRKLRSKDIASIKVQWKNRPVEESTWENETDMQERYPHLFTSSGTLSLPCFSSCNPSRTNYG